MLSVLSDDFLLDSMFLQDEQALMIKSSPLCDKALSLSHFGMIPNMDFYSCENFGLPALRLTLEGTRSYVIAFAEDVFKFMQKEEKIPLAENTLNRAQAWLRHVMPSALPATVACTEPCSALLCSILKCAACMINRVQAWLKKLTDVQCRSFCTTSYHGLYRALLILYVQMGENGRE